eukprot:TRINITY_DN1447_c0_g1_i1.p2 TRINITY_DN1447_c0_g1~~TRINITY_DN1447_c0_g1_i1.p2  ORF type:complete len:192 (+),score=66.34 TRINITY_DN1447_c0_g1_i1:33-578(+)
MDQLVIATLGIVLHVVHYNASARIEHKTRIYTKVLGKNAIYYYGVLLIVSALFRDFLIEKALETDKNSFELLPGPVALWISIALFVFGFGLNLWTLKALGFKGMYNGDSFGFLMDAPVTGGPYKYFNDPQYVGTTIAMLGSAVYAQSLHGYLLTVVMGLVFYVSVVFFEGPHLTRIYSKKD